MPLPGNWDYPERSKLCSCLDMLCPHDICPDHNAYVDNTVFAFCTASVLFTLRYLRRGYLHDALLAFTASGILLGVKYNGIPIVGLILISIIIKMISHARQSDVLKKLILIILGLLILCHAWRKAVHTKHHRSWKSIVSFIS